MRVVHFSDVHWRGLTRHKEYTQVFTEFFRQMREEIHPDIIIFGGDAFHTKTLGISPEVIERVTWMFNELASVAPVYAILGNHDGNLTNENRLDAISPIVAAINNPRVTLFKKSGNHIVEGTRINLCVLSCFDEPGWSQVQTDEDLINIALFHGAVQGCETDADRVLEDGVKLEVFDRFDFAMLGDIHRFQFLAYSGHAGPTRDMRPWIGYPGSLIQQNYGEDVEKGYLVWDIQAYNSWNVSFHPIPNSYQFITVTWQGNVATTVTKVLEVAEGTLESKRVRIVSDQTVFHLQMKELYDELKGAYGASEVVFKAKKAEQNLSPSFGTRKSAISVRNNPDTLCEFYETFTSKVALTEGQRGRAHEFIRSSVEKIRLSEDESPRDVVWSIKDLEFSNLYRFGGSNRIRFSHLSGITGIFGPNRVGKSSVVGALMFGLFNTTDRGPVKSAYIINKNKSYGDAKVTINVAGTDYIVERSVQKSSRRGLVDEEKAAVSLVLSKVNKNGGSEEIVSENSDSRTDTDKVIRKLIGTSQDFLLTAFSNQGGMTKFIDEGPTQRKAILNRFLDLDIFDKLYKTASFSFAVLSAKASRFSSTNWSAEKQKCEGDIGDCNKQIGLLQSELTATKEKHDDIRIWLQGHGLAKQLEVKKKLAALEINIKTLEASMTDEEERYSINEAACTKLRRDITAAERSLSEVPLEELCRQSSALKTLAEEHSKLKLELDVEKKKLEAQVKSVKKLETVPCGPGYPNCHYIKDSHLDQRAYPTQLKLVEDVLRAYGSVKEELDTLQQNKVEEKIKSYAAAMHNIESWKRSVEATEALLASISKHNFSLDEQLETAKKTRTALLTELGKQDDLTSKVEAEKVLAATVKSLEKSLGHQNQTMGASANRLETLTKDAVEAAQIIEEQKVYDSIMQAFSKNGIPAMVLKSKLPEINAELDNILAGSVSFRVFLETEVGSNTLDVYLEDKDSRRVIELASGMEKMIASLAIRVALISLSSLPKPDIFIMDEGWGSLDGTNIAKSIELLQTIKSRFRAVLIISHVEEIREAANSIISISDNGPESSVSY